MQKIVIAICTYRRPEGLKACLETVIQQVISTELRSTMSCDIVVIDNSPNAETPTIVQNIQEKTKNYKIFLVDQPIKGISQARNMALKFARENNYAALIFIDDDEEVSAGWLQTMLSTWIYYKVPVVTGPVVSIASGNVPKWFERTKPMARRQLPTGIKIDLTATGNVLISEEIYRDINNVFDERFSEIGGEDAHFFARLSQKGHSIIWCNEAIVTEKIAESRFSLKWVLRRGFRVGEGWTKSTKLLYSKPAVFCKTLVYSVWRFLRSIGFLLIAIATLKKEHFYSAMFCFAQTLGTCVGFFLTSEKAFIKEYK